MLYPYPNQIYTTFALLGFVLSVIPFKWHLQAWNTGTCLYMAWTAVSCLIAFINSIVWYKTALNHTPIWGDITTHIQVGYQVAIPAASLCINRRLYNIASVQSVTITRNDKRRAIITDLLIGLGLPILEMVLYTIPQGHRYDVYENIGPFFTLYDTWAAYVFVRMWPLVLGAISSVYCVMTLIEFHKRRTQFSSILSANRNLTASRYFRLMGLAGIDLLCTIPLNSYMIYLCVTAYPIKPWISWENVHVKFYRVVLYPEVIWAIDPVMRDMRELSRWSPVICAFVFFAFFGFADEAQRRYRTLISSVATFVGVKTSTASSTTQSASGWQFKSATATASFPAIQAGAFDGTRSGGRLSTISTDSDSVADEKGLSTSPFTLHASDAPAKADPSTLV